MRAYIKEITGRIEFAVEYEGKTAKDVRQRMDEVIASRGEGLVIKHPDSEYVLNGRNKDWIKVSHTKKALSRLKRVAKMCRSQGQAGIYGA